MDNDSCSGLYIGLISGTSVDGIDAGLFDFRSNPPTLQAQIKTPYPDNIKNQILKLSETGDNEIEQMGILDGQIGELFAESVLSLLQKANIRGEQIDAIGSHGQTIRHRPYAEPGFSLQIGNPTIITQETGITTVADFRRRDLAAGGQGAPLAPAFHQAVFYSETEKRCVVNIGGMSNISVLNSDTNLICGYDTGPGNVLLDTWVKRNLNLDYDRDGKWAESGAVHDKLLATLLLHPYFSKKAPKSTGREDFHLPWLLDTLLDFEKISANDIQSTLCELTALSVAQCVQSHDSDAVYICGGGANNLFLMKRLETLLPEHTVDTTTSLGISPDWVETGLCAWLAKRTLDRQVGNIPSVTGAEHEVILGAIYPA